MPKTKNDFRVIKEVLMACELKFKEENILQVEDCSFKEIEEALDKIRRRVISRQVARLERNVFFFVSAHGCQIDGELHLVYPSKLYEKEDLQMVEKAAY